MPDHPRVSEVLSLSSILSLSSLTQASGPPGPGACHHNGLGLRKYSRGKGHPDARPGSPTTGAGHPPESEPRRICQPQHAGEILSRRSKTMKSGSFSKSLESGAPQGFLERPALACDSFLSIWGGSSGNQPSFLNPCPLGGASMTSELRSPWWSPRRFQEPPP